MRHHSQPRQTVARVRRIWSELDYAQRRLFEVRTGVPATGAASQRRDEMLEDLYRRGWQR